MKRSLAVAIGPTPPWALELRTEAIARVQAHPLLQSISKGDRDALVLLLRGFWEFVRVFPAIIDEQCRRHRRAITRAAGPHIADLSDEVETMCSEEGDHAQHWVDLGVSAGTTMPALDDPILQAVARLIKYMRGASPADFFAGLNITEVIAFALGEVGLRPTAPQDVDTRWYEVHVEHEALGHEEIDRFLGVQLYEKDGEGDVENRFRTAALYVLDMFNAVADEIVAMV